MKTIITSLMLLGCTNAFAFTVDASQEGRLSVSELYEAGATEIVCVLNKPTCVLRKFGYGIMYPGEKVEDVFLTAAYTLEGALRGIRSLKAEGLYE